MKIPVFLHTSNPSVDAPQRFKSRSWVMSKIAAGVVVAVVAMIGGVRTEAAQYVDSPKACAQARRTPEQSIQDIGYARAVSHGRDLVWVPSGLTWQMKPTYGSIARHFGRTRRKDLNCAPNKTTSPREHLQATGNASLPAAGAQAQA